MARQDSSEDGTATLQVSGIGTKFLCGPTSMSPGRLQQSNYFKIDRGFLPSVIIFVVGVVGRVNCLLLNGKNSATDRVCTEGAGLVKTGGRFLNFCCAKSHSGAGGFSIASFITPPSSNYRGVWRLATQLHTMI